MKLTETDIAMMAEELVRFHEQFQGCYGQKRASTEKGLPIFPG